MNETRTTSVFRDSAFTLKHKRACTYTFSRAERFRSAKRADGAEFVTLPSTLTHRGTSQGYGQRWKPTDTGVISPAPGSYNLPSTLNPKLGPKYTRDSPSRGKDPTVTTPGPGAYDLLQPLGKFAPKFTFRPRILKVKTIESPPPDAYSPKFLTDDAYKNISFGIGERKFLHSLREDSPGPGAYNIKGVLFNKYATRAQ